MMQKKAGLYIRVSTTEQAEEGYSVGSQTEKLKAYCTAMDYLVYDIYTDGGFTGTNLNRPAMQKLISDVKNGYVDIAIVMKLDRLSRSQKDTLYLIEDVFIANNCEFVSVTESFDTSTPYGRAFIGILAVFAQFERERMQERITDGKTERAKDGKIMAWAHPAIGYDYINESYVVNEYEAELVRTCFDLCEQGLSINKIKAVVDEKFALGTKHKTKDGKYHLNTIKRILRNRTYLGIVKYAGQEYPGQHEPLITKEQFDKVQSILELNSKNALGARKNPFRSTHLLTGLLFCADCGARIHAQARRNVNNNRWYYICYSVSKTSKKYRTSDDCCQEVIDGETMDEYVWNTLKELDITCDIPNEPKESNSEFLLVMKKRMESINQKMNKLLDLYLEDKFSKEELEKKNKSLLQEKETIEKEIEKVENQTENTITRTNALSELMKLDNVYKNGTLEDKKRFISLFIDRIEVHNGEINIRLNRMSD